MGDPASKRERDVEILRRIRRQFGGSMALNAWAAKCGRVAVGDKVDLLDAFEAGPPAVLGRFALQDAAREEK